MAKRGRPKGSGNRPLKRLLHERLAEKYPDYDPILDLVDSCIKIKQIAETTGELSDYKSAVDSTEKLAQYLQPRLKSVENTGDSKLVVSLQRKRYDGNTE
tara:strand:+ start:374 stop:673 length:300 start_codon:yes stop_codon:yes gene_type:complete